LIEISKSKNKITNRIFVKGENGYPLQATSTVSMKDKEKTPLHMVDWRGASVTAETLE